MAEQKIRLIYGLAQYTRELINKAEMQLAITVFG